jgi:hypothetical protein
MKAVMVIEFETEDGDLTTPASAMIDGLRATIHDIDSQAQLYLGIRESADAVLAVFKEDR